MPRHYCTHLERAQSSPPVVAVVASEAQAQDVSGEASAAAASADAAAAKSESERAAMDTGDAAAPQVLSDAWVIRQRMRAETRSPCWLHYFVLVRVPGLEVYQRAAHIHAV